MYFGEEGLKRPSGLAFLVSPAVMLARDPFGSRQDLFLVPWKMHSGPAVPLPSALSSLSFVGAIKRVFCPACLPMLVVSMVGWAVHRGLQAKRNQDFSKPDCRQVVCLHHQSGGGKPSDHLEISQTAVHMVLSYRPLTKAFLDQFSQRLFLICFTCLIHEHR